MRIGLLTDTHIPYDAKELPAELLKAFQGVDLILHAGDIYRVSVLDELESIAPVLAARGDDDYGDTLKDPRVKEKHVLELEGQTLWLMHQRPYELIYPPFQGKWTTTQAEQDTNGAPDVVVFGHEHRTVVEEIHSILLVNSGSPTFLKYHHGLGTVGILDVSADGVEARIVQL